ncbi:putative ribonuclease H-like domain-containing protein, partial [Tanacetum coccineum]
MNGDAPAIASASTEGPIPPKTAEQKLARKNELKAKSTLLLAIPDEHLLKFHGIKDAKTLWEAIKARIKTIDTDDLVRMDLKWQVAMLTMRGTKEQGMNEMLQERIIPLETPANVIGCSRWDMFIQFIKLKYRDENTRKSVIEQHTYRQAENLRKSQSPRVFVCGSLNHLIKDCNFYENKMVGKSMLNNMGRVTGQREVRPVWNNAQRGNPQYALQDQGIFDSGCSRHMTGNKSYLTDYQDIDGGFVAFAGSPKGARTMLADSLLPTAFWAKAVNTACYVQNRVLVTKPHNKTPYELLLGRPPSISFMRPFGCPVTILNTLDPLGKFDRKADVGFLVGYSIISKAFRVFNIRIRKVEENLHINFLENKPNVAGSGPEWLFDIDSLTKSMNYEPVTTGNQTNGDADNKDADEVPGKGDDDLSERNGQEKEEKEGYTNNTNRVSTVNPSVNAAGQGFDNVDDQERIDSSTQDVNTAGPSINTSLEATGIFDDAYDDREEVGAEADLNNLETTMNVSSIPTTRIHKDHLIEQIIRDLHSAPLTRRMSQQDLEELVRNKARLVAQDYTQEEGIHYDEVFAPVARIEAIRYMLMISSLGLQRRLQVQQKEDGIFISQDKYVVDILKKFDLVTIKAASTPIETNKALLKDEEAEDVDVHLYRSMIGSLMYLTASRPDIMFAVCACARDSPFDLEAFSDSDYAGASLDRESITGAEYVTTANCCGKVLWIQNQMLYYGFNFINTKIHIDNESTICIVKNPVFHSKTKHIEIRHHFIRYSYEKKLVQVIKIYTYHSVAYLLTKAFDVSCGPIHLVAYETIYKEWEDRMERAATTTSSLEAEFEAASKQSNDPPLSRVNTLGSGEDNMKLIELMEHYTKLSELIQALVDKKKVIISETSIRSDLKLDDAEGTNCLPTATIFAELERIGAKTTSWNEFSRTMASAIICLATNQNFNLSKYIFNNMVKNLDGGLKFLMYPRFVQVFLDKQVEGMSKHKGVYVTPSHTKKVFSNIKRPCKGFSRRVTSLFSIMMVQATEDMGANSATPTDSHSTPIITQPSSSKPQKKKSRRKQRKDNAPTEPTTKETTLEEHVSTLSYDLLPSGDDRMQLAKLMSLCTNIHEKVLDLEKAKTAQAKEITFLKKRVKQLEKRRKSRNSGLKRLRKEDASNKGRKIKDLDADAEVTLVNETQEMNDDNLMFVTGVLEDQEIKFEKVVEEPIVSVSTTTKSIPFSAAEVVTTASASVVIPDELTLAQTLIELKTAKPKPVTTAATIVTSVRPRAKGIIFYDQEEHVPTSSKTFSSSQSQLPQVKDKGKGKMVEPEV